MQSRLLLSFVFIQLLHVRMYSSYNKEMLREMRPSPYIIKFVSLYSILLIVHIII